MEVNILQVVGELLPHSPQLPAPLYMGQNICLPQIRRLLPPAEITDCSFGGGSGAGREREVCWYLAQAQKGLVTALMNSFCFWLSFLDFFYALGYLAQASSGITLTLLHPDWIKPW